MQLTPLLISLTAFALTVCAAPPAASAPPHDGRFDFPAYNLTLQSKNDPSVNGNYISLQPVKDGATVYTAQANATVQHTPFYLNGTILFTKNDKNDPVYAQLDLPVQTFFALTFNGAGYQGEANMYHIEKGKLLFGQMTEFYVCGKDKLLALYPPHAPQQGCKGVEVVATPVKKTPYSKNNN